MIPHGDRCYMKNWSALHFLVCSLLVHAYKAIATRREEFQSEHAWCMLNRVPRGSFMSLLQSHQKSQNKLVLSFPKLLHMNCDTIALSLSINFLSNCS
jgi:hypothetical protein